MDLFLTLQRLKQFDGCPDIPTVNTVPFLTHPPNFSKIVGLCLGCELGVIECEENLSRTLKKEKLSQVISQMPAFLVGELQSQIQGLVDNVESVVTWAFGIILAFQAGFSARNSQNSEQILAEVKSENQQLNQLVEGQAKEITALNDELLRQLDAIDTLQAKNQQFSEQIQQIERAKTIEAEVSDASIQAGIASELESAVQQLDQCKRRCEKLELESKRLQDVENGFFKLRDSVLQQTANVLDFGAQQIDTKLEALNSLVQTTKKQSERLAECVFKRLEIIAAEHARLCEEHEQSKRDLCTAQQRLDESQSCAAERISQLESQAAADAQTLTQMRQDFDSNQQQLNQVLEERAEETGRVKAFVQQWAQQLLNECGSASGKADCIEQENESASHIVLYDYVENTLRTTKEMICQLIMTLQKTIDSSRDAVTGFDIIPVVHTYVEEEQQEDTHQTNTQDLKTRILLLLAEVQTVEQLQTERSSRSPTLQEQFNELQGRNAEALIQLQAMARLLENLQKDYYTLCKRQKNQIIVQQADLLKELALKTQQNAQLNAQVQSYQNSIISLQNYSQDLAAAKTAIDSYSRAIEQIRQLLAE